MLDLNKKAIGRCGFTAWFSPVFCDNLRSNTGRYIRIVTGLLLMQISGLTDQCNTSFFYYLSFHGLHKCESINTSNLLIRIALMPKQEDNGENRS